MSKEKKLTILFVVLIFSYLFYLTSCLSEVEEPTGTQEPSTSTATDDVWVSSSTSTFLPTTSGTSTEATEEIIRLAMNPAQGGPLSSFQTADFTGPSVCATCHIGLIDQSGKDVSMPSDWRSTMMAHSGVDPVWQAKVSSEVARNPELQEVIEQKCVTCHMPMARPRHLWRACRQQAWMMAFIPLNTLIMPLVSMGSPVHSAIRLLTKIWAPWKASVDITSSILLQPHLTARFTALIQTRSSIKCGIRPATHRLMASTCSALSTAPPATTSIRPLLTAKAVFWVSSRNKQLTQNGSIQNLAANTNPARAATCRWLMVVYKFHKSRDD